MHRFAAFVAVLFLIALQTLNTQAQIGIVATNNQATTGTTTVSTGNGIEYHGGPVMSGTPNVYFIWYGSWQGNTALNILPNFITVLGGSPYLNTNTTYSDSSGRTAPRLLSMSTQIFDNYSHGSTLSDAAVEAIVSRGLSNGLPTDSNGVYSC
jgi:hypothetical protein